MKNSEHFKQDYLPQIATHFKKDKYKNNQVNASYFEKDLDYPQARGKAKCSNIIRDSDRDRGCTNNSIDDNNLARVKKYSNTFDQISRSISQRSKAKRISRERRLDRLLFNDWAMSDSSEYLSTSRPDAAAVYKADALLPKSGRNLLRGEFESVSDNDLRLPSSETEDKKRSRKVRPTNFTFAGDENLAAALKRKYLIEVNDGTGDRSPSVRPSKPLPPLRTNKLTSSVPPSAAATDKEVRFNDRVDERGFHATSSLDDDVRTQMSILDPTEATTADQILQPFHCRRNFDRNTFVAFEKIMCMPGDTGDRENQTSVKNCRETKRLQAVVDVWLKKRQSRGQQKSNENNSNADGESSVESVGEVGAKADEFSYLTAPRHNNYGFEYMRWARETTAHRLEPASQ